MKAAVFQGPGRPFAIEEVAVPALRSGDMLLKVKHCGICGTDLHYTEGGDSPVKAGSVLGHEFCGEIAAVRPGVADGWNEGDRAVSLPFVGCGTCKMCLSGQPVWCRAMRDHASGRIPGGFAEYVRIGAAGTVKLPASVSWSQAALVEPLAVGLHGVRRARLEPGADILVVGAGPIGLAAVIWARALGARHIVVTARSSGRAELARSMGATEFVQTDQDVRRAFRKIAGGPPEAIFDCVRAPGTVDFCIQLVPIHSQIVVLGACGGADMIRPTAAMNKELVVNFALAYGVRDFEIAVYMLARGAIDPTSLITEEVGSDGFPAVVRGAASSDDAMQGIADAG